MCDFHFGLSDSKPLLFPGHPLPPFVELLNTHGTLSF